VADRCQTRKRKSNGGDETEGKSHDDFLSYWGVSRDFVWGHGC
jgi:hypothetical protein